MGAFYNFFQTIFVHILSRRHPVIALLAQHKLADCPAVFFDVILSFHPVRDCGEINLTFTDNS